MMPVPQHEVEKHGDAWLKPEHIAVNGPYKLKEWVANDHITLLKHPRFFDAKNGHIETVNFYPAQDYAQALKRFRAGEFDLTWGVPSSEIAWLRNNMPGVLHIAPYVAVNYIEFNFTRPPFNDLRVRKAISMAIDREVIASRVMRAGERPAYAMVPPGIPGYPGKAQFDFKSMPMAKRFAEARALLREAGYGPDNPLSFVYSFPGQTDPRMVAVALQAMWSQIGVNVTLRPADNQVHYAQLRRQHFDAAWAGWSADYLDAKDFVFLGQTSAKDMNTGRYSNPKFDSLIDESDRTRDPVARGALLQQAEQIMLDDQALAPLFFTMSRGIVSRQVKNWVDNDVNINRTRYLSLDRRIVDV
jgi:oligopeptide transport system substrate-binding protein